MYAVVCGGRNINTRLQPGFFKDMKKSAMCRVIRAGMNIFINQRKNRVL